MGNSFGSFYGKKSGKSKNEIKEASSKKNDYDLEIE